MNFIFAFSDVGFSIRQVIRTLCGRISSLIYDFIVIEYDLFTIVSRASILDNDFVEQIYKKVGMLLGLFMLFRLIFSLVQHMIEPSKFNDKKIGFISIIKRSIISIVLLGITPTIFKFAFEVQNYIVGSNDSNNNIIYKLIIGEHVSSNVKTFGNKLSSDLFFSFYKERDGYVLDNGIAYDENGIPVLDNFATLKKNIEAGHSFDTTVDYLSLRKYNNYVIEYNEIFSIGVGCVVAWILIMYIVQVSVRVINLAFLQIIAPIPILSYISDSEGAFQKWIKQCISVYLDLFIRVALIYFIVYLSSTVMSSFSNPNSILMSSIGNVSPIMAIWVKIFIILGLLLFAKKVPDLLKELFPNIGKGPFSYSLNPSKVFNDTAAAKAIGATVGAAGGLASNTVHGYMNTKKAFKEKGFAEGLKALGKTGFSMVGGTLGGAKAGLKTKDITKMGDAVKVSNENREKRELKAEAGYHWYRPDKVVRDKVLSFSGETSGAEAQIKTAEFRKEALHRSKEIQWENFSKTHATADLALLRSMQEFEINGKKLWKGIDSTGKERTFELRGTNYIATDGRGNVVGDSAKIVSVSANIDKQIKKQAKIIKGLQTADRDSKK